MGDVDRRTPVHEDVEEATLLLKAISGQLQLFVPEYIPNAYKKLLRGKLTWQRMTFWY